MSNVIKNLIQGLNLQNNYPIDSYITQLFNLYYNFGTAQTVSSTALASVYGMAYFTNNEYIPLYYQYNTTVTLASGSVAVINSIANTNLGSIAVDGSLAFYNMLLCTIAKYPSTDEIETITVTVNRYTDSAYSNLYDTVQFATYNLHMYSSLLTSLSTVINSDTFDNSTDSWTGTNVTPTLKTSPYYNSSGYSLFPSSPNNSNTNYLYNTFPLYAYISKTFTLPSTYTDGIVEFYIKLINSGFNIIPQYIEIDYSDGSTSDLYGFYLSNYTNWFICAVHIKPTVTNTLKFNAWGNITGIYNGLYNPIYIGQVNYIGKLSGAF